MYLWKVVSFPRDIQLSSAHNNWYVCQDNITSINHPTHIILNYKVNDMETLARCSFIFNPLPENGDPLQNCKDVVGPPAMPNIFGQSTMKPETPPTRAPVARYTSSGTLPFVMLP